MHEFVGVRGDTFQRVALLIHAFALEHHTLLCAELENRMNAFHDDIGLGGFSQIFYRAFFEALQLLSRLIEGSQHQHWQRGIRAPRA